MREGDDDGAREGEREGGRAKEGVCSVGKSGAGGRSILTWDHMRRNRPRTVMTDNAKLDSENACAWSGIPSTSCRKRLAQHQRMMGFRRRAPLVRLQAFSVGFLS